MAEIHFDDTIAAIATPLGEGGISVIRVSGPSALKLIAAIFKSAKGRSIEDLDSHTLHLGEIRDADHKVMDQVIVSLFKAPNSYTGEDVIEISCHGGMVVTHQILQRVINQGIRHAEPGEFTRRAFLNGKMDLTQAEAVLDLIKAKSDLSRQVATRQLSGSLSRVFKLLKEDLMQFYAHMEAYVDFPEDDLEVYTSKEFKEKFESIEKTLSNLIGSFQRGSLLREGASVVILGKPNVGKSSLFNALLERDRSIVSEYEGTTRDLIEESLDIRGIYIRLVDTAGLAEGAITPLDQMGMERTRSAIERGDLFLFLVDGSVELQAQDEKAFRSIPKGKPTFVLVNKSDLPQKISAKAIQALTGEVSAIAISTLQKDGLDILEQKMANYFYENTVNVESEQITKLRHRNSLKLALESIQTAKQAYDAKQPLECVTVDIKAALDALRELVGEVYSEDLLDVIFSEFCIGK